MKANYLLIELLQSFSDKERTGFSQYVNCTYFNGNKKVAVLLDELLIHIEKDSLDFLLQDGFFKDKEKARKEQNKFRVNVSILLKLAKEFLMIQALKENETAQLDLLQSKLLEKKQFRLYEQYIRQCKKKLESPKKGLDFYAYQYCVESSLLDYSQLKGSIAKDNNIEQLKICNMLIFALNQLSLHLVEISISEKTLFYRVNFAHINSINSILKLPELKSHPLIKVYRAVVLLMEEKSEHAFLKLVGSLDKHSEEIPSHSLVNFYNSLLNFCILQIRNKKINFKKYQFELYKIMDSKNLLLWQGKLSAGSLRNIIIHSCRTNEFDWAIKVLNKYIGYIRKEIRKDVKAFNLATIAYFKKDYQIAIDCLFPLPYISLSYDINRRIIMFKCYFEIDEYYLIPRETQFRSFEKYIMSNKAITKSNKKSYKNFIRILINLYRVKHKEGKMTIDRIKEKLAAQQINSNKDWLLEKIGALE